MVAPVALTTANKIHQPDATTTQYYRKSKASLFLVGLVSSILVTVSYLAIASYVPTYYSSAGT